jgi:hypothetical protein
MPLFNLTDYTVLDHVYFATGCLLWVFVYILVIKNIHKYKYVEIPLAAIAVNFAWEFLWSFVFKTNMGEIYIWGYRAWFLLDCYIVYHAFKYGYKQLESGMPAVWAKYILCFWWCAWVFILYWFTVKFDMPQSGMGGYGGYWCNLLMSAVYITLLMRTKDVQYFSFGNSLLKGIGTLLVTFFCFNHAQWKGEWFLYSLGIVTAMLDFIYIVLVYKKKKKVNVSLG